MEFMRASGNPAYKMQDTYTLDNLRNILLHPGDFKQTIATTYDIITSKTIQKDELINTINEINGDVSQQNIALWVCNKMYLKNTYQVVEDEDKENVNPNASTKKKANIIDTSKYTLADLNTLFDMECQGVLHNFRLYIDNNINKFVNEVFTQVKPQTLWDYITQIIKESKTYIEKYPQFTFFIKRLLYDRLIHFMDRLTHVKNVKNVENVKIINYWNSLISEFINENLREYTNLEIDPIISKTPYSITIKTGGRRRKIKKTKKTRLRKIRKR
jgi:hypothetical protein